MVSLLVQYTSHHTSNSKLINREKKKFKIGGTELRSHFFTNTCLSEYTTVKWSIDKESIVLLSVFVLKSTYDNISGELVTLVVSFALPL